MACVIVLGSYRSGTSAVAGVLYNLGVMMGKEFDKPAQSNPTGYFEDLEFKRLFDMLSEGKDVTGLMQVLAKIREFESPIWGVKDPQLCLYLNRFLRVLETDIKIISTYRPTTEICESLARAIPGQTNETFLPLVQKHLDQKQIQLAEFRGPVLEIKFEDLKSNKEAEIKRIADFVGLPVTQSAIDFIHSGNL